MIVKGRLLQMPKMISTVIGMAWLVAPVCSQLMFSGVPNMRVKKVIRALIRPLFWLNSHLHTRPTAVAVVTMGMK